MLSGVLEVELFAVPCSHLVVYETDLGGRRVFLRTKESFAGCFPLEPLVIKDPASSSELSSVRSERSVNSRSAGVDMTSESDDDGGVPSIRGRSVTVGPRRDASVAAKSPPFQSSPPASCSRSL